MRARNLIILLIALGTGKLTAQTAEVTYVTSTNYYLALEAPQRGQGDTLLINNVAHAVVATSSLSVVVLKSTLELAKGQEVQVQWKTALPPPVEEESGVADEFVEAPLEEQRSIAPDKEVSVKLRSVARLSVDGLYFGNGTVEGYARTAQRLLLNQTVQLSNHELGFRFTGTNKYYTDFVKDASGNFAQVFQMNAYGSSRLNRVKLDWRLGRHTPLVSSSLGPVDGVSVGAGFKPLSVYVIGGFVPNYQDFTVDMSRPVYGAFIATPKPMGKAKFHGTLGLVEYKGTDSAGTLGIDRQMLYQQVRVQLSSRVQFYSAMELDLYGLDSVGQEQRSWSTTGWFTSLRWRMTPKDHLFFSYDSRKPRVFYQQFDTEWEQQLFDLGVQKGWRMRYQHRFGKANNWGISGTYRTRTTQDYGFYMLSSHVVLMRPMRLPGRLRLSGNYSSTGSYATLMLGGHYYWNMGKDLKLSAFVRYLDYMNTSAAVGYSGRLYSGFGLEHQAGMLNYGARLSLSSREGVYSPQAHLFLTYRFTK